MTVLQAIQNAFRQCKWEFQPVEKREVVRAQFDAHHTRVHIHVEAFNPLNAVSVVATSSSQVPESRSGLINEMAMRTNRTLTVGNFELDYETQHLLFRATNIFPKGNVDPSIIASLVHSAVVEMDRITPFLTLLLRMDAAELAKLNLPLFLMREDLLPPVPEVPKE
jgi:hypothetical protein